MKVKGWSLGAGVSGVDWMDVKEYRAFYSEKHWLCRSWGQIISGTCMPNPTSSTKCSESLRLSINEIILGAMGLDL